MFSKESKIWGSWTYPRSFFVSGYFIRGLEQ